jgi:hypothetical protein
MTLHILPDLIQGTDEWLEQRRGIVTASVVSRLITPSTIRPANNPDSRALTMQLAAERITRWTDPTYMSDDMLRGIEDEPRARDLYAEHYAPVDEVGFMVLERDGWRLGYSPDGLVGDDGLIEVKSRRPKKHLQTILADEVPAENMAQIQAGLLVSGRDWLDYVSYCGGMPLWVKRVRPDKRWHDAISVAVAACEDAVSDMTANYLKAVDGLPTTERVLEQEMTF